MLYTLISVFLFGIDSWIKNKREDDTSEYDLCDGKMHISTYHNNGVFLNFMEKYPSAVKITSLVLTLAMTLLFILTLSKHGNKMLKMGLSLLLGGAFCNTYDRIKKGYVVDYVSFPKAPGKLKHIVFNISDFAIVIGAVLISLRKE